MNSQMYETLLMDALEQVELSYYVSNNWRKTIEKELISQKYTQKQREAFLIQSENYYERVFCYELYHQIRILMEDRKFKGKAILQAELVKKNSYRMERNAQKIRSN
ncbi:hypothetical protein [Saccharibacillus sacchari]|uniref:Uncharacterized protein n=1 Tax=Saccharibacillus sacchari TaxID=456493 RepID=A0ACC6PGC5_9BACL